MSYWTKRQDQLKIGMEKDEEKLRKRLSSFYDREQRKLEKQIAAYYSEYGINNVIQYRTLMEKLSDDDRKLLIEQIDKFAAKYPEYANLVPIRESIYKLNRLEGLEYSVKMQQLEIGAVNNEEITKYLNEQALKGVNAAAEVMGFGKNFYSINSNIIKQFVDVPWSNGENFSAKIWKNSDKLANYLNTDIAQGFARGDSYDKLVKQVRHRFSHVTRNDAYRLIYTEGTYVMAESSMQPFTEDFEQYRIFTVGDGKVCPICREISKEVFEIKDRQSGVNFPPFHPWCRCTFEIVVDDWDNWMGKYEQKNTQKQAKNVVEKISNTVAKTSKTNKIDINAKAIYDYMSAKSYIVNDKLRNNIELSGNEQEFIKELDYILEKLPKYNGNLQRSLYFNSGDDVVEFMKAYIIDEFVTYKEYISTTKGETYNPDGQVQIYIKDAQKGADISSYNKAEEEVLYGRGSTFKVVNIVEKDGTQYILLEEEDE